MHTMTTAPAVRRRERPAADSFLSESALRVRALVDQTLHDQGVLQSLFFSTGVVDRVERQFVYGCTIIGDSNLIATSIDRALMGRFPVRLSCFIDHPEVNAIAQQKRITRAEVCMEQALQIQGPKLIVVGSAPMALNRLLQLHRASPLREVSLIAAPTGFANAVELKEHLWESGLPCVVVRGRRGGVASAAAVVNALLQDAADHPV